MKVETQTADSLLGSDGLRVVFQPIVDMDDGRPVGYEALARGPVGSELEMPVALFAAASEEGMLGRLDRACRRKALAEALEAGLPDDTVVCLNVEPAVLDASAVLDPVAEGDLGGLSVMVELTERALASRPSEVIAAVRWLRERGCRIALDDVGADPRSLALMPFLAPDLIKLDRSLTQGLVPAPEIAKVIHAVRAESERSGAVILAEGVETEEHRRRAASMGARLGQGFLFGRPEALARVANGSGRPGRAAPIDLPRREPLRSEGTPFGRIAVTDQVTVGDKRLLLSLSRQLEAEAFAQRGEAVILATFEEDDYFTERTRRRYERLAGVVALAGALGIGMSEEPGEGVRGANLSPDDDLAQEWDVVMVGPHFAGAFVSRDLGDDGPDLERRFEYFLTYDRERVTEAARPLLHRLVRSA